jgi:hypothetical protein
MHFKLDRVESKSKYIHRLIKKDEVQKDKLTLGAVSRFISKNFKFFGLELSGQLCGCSKDFFHGQADELVRNKKTKADLSDEEKEKYSYVGFIEVNFCGDFIVTETINKRTYKFALFQTPSPEDSCHCDLVLLGIYKKLDLEDKVRLQASKVLNFKKPHSKIDCCD